MRHETVYEKNILRENYESRAKSGVFAECVRNSLLGGKLERCREEGDGTREAPRARSCRAFWFMERLWILRWEDFGGFRVGE